MTDGANGPADKRLERIENKLDKIADVLTNKADAQGLYLLAARVQHIEIDGSRQAQEALAQIKENRKDLERLSDALSLIKIRIGVWGGTVALLVGIIEFASRVGWFK